MSSGVMSRVAATLVLFEPVKSAEPVMSSGTTGAITEGGVLELLQFFQQTGKSGRLDLTGGATMCSVWLSVGAAVHATAGDKQGMDALVFLARTPPPRFSFHADAVIPPARTIEGSGPGVLMEIARQLDEQRK